MLFSNGIVRLVGTLYLPAKGTALPAVVVEHAAEAPTRDYALYRHLALGLPPIGIAVLVYDRRGSGASSGNRNEASYEQLADDAIAGKREIAKNSRIDPRKIGFWGLSQGGWLAVLAANRSGNAAFAVSVSAPLVTPEVQMKYAVRNLLIPRMATNRLHRRPHWKRAPRMTRSRWGSYREPTHCRHSQRLRASRGHR